MTHRGKQMFIFFSVIVPFIIYAAFYYAPIIRNAPFKAKEFVSFEYKWGVGNKMENSYNSATGRYSYYDDSDSLVVKTIKIDPKEFKYLDSVADVQGFWNLPKVVGKDDENIKSSKAVHYFMKFNYQKKSKEVTYFSDFDGNPKMGDAAFTMQKVVAQVLNDAEVSQR